MTFSQFHFHFVSSSGGTIDRHVPLPVLRGLVLRVIDIVDPELAKSLHNGDKTNRYTLQRRVSGLEVEIILNSFSRDIDRAMRRFLVITTNQTFNLGPVPVRLVNVHATVVEPGLLIDTAEPVSRFKIIFKTCTFFKNVDGLVVRYPEPALLTRNIARSWNELSALEPFDVEILGAWAQAHLEVVAHELRTASVHLGRGNREQVGFRGWATFAVKNTEPSDPTPRLIDILMRFAESCNVGGGRTTGLGTVAYARIVVARKTGMQGADAPAQDIIREDTHVA